MSDKHIIWQTPITDNIKMTITSDKELSLIRRLSLTGAFVGAIFKVQHDMKKSDEELRQEEEERRLASKGQAPPVRSLIGYFW